MNSKPQLECPLCGEKNPPFFTTAHGRPFFQCPSCFLVSVDPSALPSAQLEKERYRLHINEFQDKGYCRYLLDQVAPFFQKVSPVSAYFRCLDYGCGENGVLAQLLGEQGVVCDNYDPFFYPQFPSGQYDAIFCLETAEHFHRPMSDFEKIDSLLKPGGSLLVVTQRYELQPVFEKWWYVSDFTHVSFYHQKSFEYLSKHFGYQLELLGLKVCLKK